MLQIEEVLYQINQGMSGPYLCKADDGNKYIVKGRYSGRKSQICELLGWHLAQAFGLPVPPYQLLEMGEDLYEELPANLKGIGQGVSFGSLEVPGARWCEPSDLGYAREEFRRDLLIFDYWVLNEDRCSYNSNLLFRDSDKSFHVIDHNRIFEFGTGEGEILENHVFACERAKVGLDLMHQAELGARLANALPAWQDACDNLPPEWLWANDEMDVPVDFDIAQAHTALLRFNNPNFWGGL